MDTIEKAIQRLKKSTKPSGSNSFTQWSNSVERLDARQLSPRLKPEPVVTKSDDDRLDEGNQAYRKSAMPPVASSQPVSSSKGTNNHGLSMASRRTTIAKSNTTINLDFERFRYEGMIVPDERRSRIKEEYRLIKRPLLMNAMGKGAAIVDKSNLLMVTSSRPGEGKSFTAINLALSIALERDLTVLLVDADVIKPRLSAFFELDTSPGLVDFLVDDQINLSDLLVDTNLPSLTILPAGNTHHLTTELMASRNMLQLANDLSTQSADRIIIFDSPPLLATPEASVLAHLVGQIVMVVEAERTLQSNVREALSLLDPDMVIGFVLNKTRNTLGSDYYGYGYYGDSGEY